MHYSAYQYLVIIVTSISQKNIKQKKKQMVIIYVLNKMYIYVVNIIADKDKLLKIKLN